MSCKLLKHLYYILFFSASPLVQVWNSFLLLLYSSGISVEGLFSSLKGMAPTFAKGVLGIHCLLHNRDTLIPWAINTEQDPVTQFHLYQQLTSTMLLVTGCLFRFNSLASLSIKHNGTFLTRIKDLLVSGNDNSRPKSSKFL